MKKDFFIHIVVFCAAYVAGVIMARIKTPEPIMNINHAEVIGSPSGTPVIVYDPDNNKIMINTRNLPNGLDICIDGVCARDVHWRSTE